MAFYYNYFNIHISPYLDVTELVTSSVPSFQVIIHSLITLLPVIFLLSSISWLDKARSERETKQANIIVVKAFKPDWIPKLNQRRGKIILIVFLASMSVSVFHDVVGILRLIICVLFGTPEYYLHPTARLIELNQFTFFLAAVSLSVPLFMLLGNRRMIISSVIPSLAKYSVPIVITVSFFINLYYLYAKVCLNLDSAKYETFSLKTAEKAYTEEDFKLIGVTKNYYFLKSMSYTLTIPTSQVLLKADNISKPTDSFDSIDSWDIPSYSIWPPSLQKKTFDQLMKCLFTGEPVPQ
jgi:hypothetical protein